MGGKRCLSPDEIQNKYTKFFKIINLLISESLEHTRVHEAQKYISLPAHNWTKIVKDCMFYVFGKLGGLHLLLYWGLIEKYLILSIMISMFEYTTIWQKFII